MVKQVALRTGCGASLSSAWLILEHKTGFDSAQAALWHLHLTLKNAGYKVRDALQRLTTGDFDATADIWCRLTETGGYVM